MRRAVLWSTAAAVGMVLLAMLVPLAVVLRDYALEDRLSRAALEVQATESVVSGQDRGAVAVYLETVNDDPTVLTTVLYPPSPLHPDGEGVGPSPGEDTEVVRARLTGRASLRDLDDGTEILVPVSLGGSSAGPEETPVIRVLVRPPGWESSMVGAWLALLALGVALLVGALVLADRLGRSFTRPLAALAAYATTLGDRRRPDPVPAEGPPEVRDLAVAMNRLVGRVEDLLTQERAGVADLSHRLRTPVTALRLRVESLGDDEERARFAADLDELEATVDAVVREARRSEREGLVPGADAAAVLAARAAFWAPLAEDQGRALEVVVEPGLDARVRAGAEDLQALVDVLLDNVFSHTPEDAPVRVGLSTAPDGGVRLVVEDGGPGFPADLDPTDRGVSGGGSSGLGLAIAARTAVESGGTLAWGTSTLGGARVVVDLGPA